MHPRGLLLAALLALAGCGQPARDWPKPSPALWEVSGPGGQHGWLFGTIHSLPEGAKWRTPAVDKAFEESDVLVVEIPNLGDTTAAKEAFDRLATTPGLPPLSQRVPEVERPALAAFLKQAGMSDDSFGSTETWAAALQLANAARGSAPVTGVDSELLANAKQVVGLETFDEQYGVFDALSPDEQVDLLMLQAVDSEGQYQDKRLVDWLTGDIAALDRDSSVGILGDPELRRALQSGRNEKWIGRIVDLFASRRRPFVAVGEGHMFGDESLPDLLRARGYTVKRVQ
jgi:uncharacterized protein YbaP (TraB family)